VCNKATDIYKWPLCKCRVVICSLAKNSFNLSSLPGDLLEMKLSPRFLTLPQLSSLLPLVAFPGCFLKQGQRDVHVRNWTRLNKEASKGPLNLVTRNENWPVKVKLMVRTETARRHNCERS
jgi:hypothetical protein